MNQDGVAAAQTELRRTSEKLEQLRAATDLNDIKDAWSDFLTSYNRIFTKLEQASKVGSSKGWFDAIKNNRRTTPELSYLLHARNADEHGIAAVYEEAAPDVRIGAAGESVYVESLTMNSGQLSGRIHGREKPPSVSVRKARIELVTVKDRGVDYPAPVNEGSAFRDKRTPIELAEIGYKYAERIMAEAVALE